MKRQDYIDAVCDHDELGIKPPVSDEVDYDEDSDLWSLWFEFKNEFTGEEDIIPVHFETKEDADEAVQEINESRFFQEQRKSA